MNCCLLSQILLREKLWVWCVGGRIGGCGIESMADRIVRNGIRDGLAANVASRSMACPFLYTVKVMLFPAILCWPI